MKKALIQAVGLIHENKAQQKIRIFVYNSIKYFALNLKQLVLVFSLLTMSGFISANVHEPDSYWQGTLGPLNIRSLSPGQALRLAPMPKSPYGLPGGET